MFHLLFKLLVTSFWSAGKETVFGLNFFCSVEDALIQPPVVLQGFLHEMYNNSFKNYTLIQESVLILLLVHTQDQGNWKAACSHHQRILLLVHTRLERQSALNFSFLLLRRTAPQQRFISQTSEQHKTRWLDHEHIK